MSLIKLQGNASGTGAFTIAAPNGNTDRTLTLPDATGTVLAAPAGAVTISSSAPSNSLTLDGSGNLGLGVTPSAWAGGFKALQVAGSSSAAFSGDTASAHVTTNTFYDGSNWKYIASAAAMDYYQFGGQHVWRNAPSGTAGNAITFTQAMTLDASGRLGLGRTSPTDYGAGTTTLSIDGTAGGFADFYYNGTRAGLIAAGNGQFVLDTATSVPLVFKTQAAERARIDASGNLLLGGGSTVYAKFTVTNNTGHSRAVDMISGASGYFDRFLFNGVDNGSITLIGGGVSYNTTSDYRRKENILPLSGASNLLAQIPVYTFNYIDYADRTISGFLAHEVQAVVPEAVTGFKDEVDDEGNPKYQGIDQSKLVPLLTAALQEALAEIANLKTRLTALEAN